MEATVGEPEKMSGRIVRSVDMRGRIVSEQFRVILDPLEADETYLHWHSPSAQLVDVFYFANQPRWDPALVYTRAIPEADEPGFDAKAFFASNLVGAGDVPVVVDLRLVEPMEENRFWPLLATVGGRGHSSLCDET